MSSSSISTPAGVGPGAPDPGPEPPRGPARRWGRAAVAVAAGLAAWLTLLDFRLVNPLPRGVDDSWAQALGYCYKHRLQAGADYLFTYGPFGYFLHRAYDPDLYWQKLGWELAVKLAFTLTLLQLLAAYPSWIARMVAYSALLLSARLILGIQDLHYTFFLLAQGVLLVRSRGRPFGPVRLAGVALLALLALTKFTLSLLSLSTLVVVAGTEVMAGRRLKALQPLLAFAGLFVLGWWALGQSPANIPRYVYGSMQISAGYAEAMALPGERAEVLIALRVLLLLAAGAAIRRPADWRLPGTAGAAVLIGLGLFLEWKHGFVRQDQHAFGFFSLAFLTPLLFPAALPTQRWPALARGLVLGAACVLAAFGMIANLQSQHQYYPHSVSQFLGETYQAVRTNVRTLLNPAALRRELDGREAQLDATCQLPRIKAAVGDAPVDIFSFEQGVLFRNRLNWRPRPVFQSYTAYTPYLIRANADFYAGDRAPAFVIYKIEPIDQRLPMLEDAPALWHLLARYRPVLIENAYLLLRRDAAPAPPVAPHPVRQQVVRLNEEVPLPDPAGAPQWLSLDLQPSLKGKLWSFLYRPNLVYIRLRTDEGRTLLYRFIPGMARTGFLINPLMQTYSPSPSRRVVSFCLLAQPHGPSCYRPEARMTVASLPRPRHPLPVEEFGRLLLPPSFQTCPAAVRSSNAVCLAESDGRDVLLVQADGQMLFPLAPEAHRLKARYGLVAGAYENGRTEGVRFTVEYQPEGGPARVLFERSLEPLTRSADRGPHELDLPVPTGAPATLVLKTTALPGKDTGFGWSYWSDLAIH